VLVGLFFVVGGPVFFLGVVTPFPYNPQGRGLFGRWV